MAEQTVRVTVDGKEFSASGEKTILQLFNESNLEHPQICHVPEVDPIQTCDTCIVEVNGKLMRACSTKLENGMHIESLKLSLFYSSIISYIYNNNQNNL
ncbi:Putative formate dehydrogenase SA2102 [Streptococcus pneumoniae]|nr:Putative formate dehydrogenase SA2102 [Streptococcus pneumoniae]